MSLSPFWCSFGVPSPRRLWPTLSVERRPVPILAIPRCLPPSPATPSSDLRLSLPLSSYRLLPHCSTSCLVLSCLPPLFAWSWPLDSLGRCPFARRLLAWHTEGIDLL